MIWCAVHPYLLNQTPASAIKERIYDREKTEALQERVSVSLFKGGADGSMSGNIQKGEVWLSEGGEEGRW